MVAMVEHEIVQLDRQFWQAIMDRDIDFCRRTMADDVVVVSSEGIAGKEETLKMLASPEGRMTGYELGEMMVRELTEDCVLLAYRAHMTGEYKGQQMSMDLNCSSVFVLRHGQWLAAFHQETPVQPMDK